MYWTFSTLVYLKSSPKWGVIAPDLLSYSITAQLRSSSFKLSSCWAIHNLSIKTMTGRRLMQRRSRCQKPVAICKTSLEFSIGILHNMGKIANKNGGSTKWGWFFGWKNWMVSPILQWYPKYGDGLSVDWSNGQCTGGIVVFSPR